MPFTAPTFADGPGFLPGWLGGTLGVTPPSAPSQTPEQAAAAEEAANQALLKKLNLPPGWTIVSHASAEGTDSKGAVTNKGLTAITLAGPNGEPGQVLVDQNGNIPVGGELQPAPKQPTPTQPPTHVSPGEGVIDPTTGAVTVPVPAKEPAPRSTVVAPGDSIVAPDGTVTTPVPKPVTPAKTQAQIDQEAADAHTLVGLRATSDAAAIKAQQAGQALAAVASDQAQQKIDFDKWKAQYDIVHQQAQDAVAEANEATRKYEAEQTAQYQKGQLANQTAQTAEAARANAARETETTRSNQAGEANQAATLLERQQADQQASADKQAQTGAGLLQQHATEATGALNNWVNAAAGNKNFGLGGPIPGNLGGMLMGDATNFATQAMGGQSVMDQAAQMVHSANPALSATPAGAGYTAIAAQMIDRASQPKMQAPQTDSTDNSNTADAVSGGAGISPSDPRFLGSVIGSAVQHFIAPTPFAQSDISEGSR